VTAPATEAVTEAADRATRDAYRDALVELMRTDPRVYCLDSDTGLFAKVDWGAAGGRYVNLGIAEQCLVGVAAGLAAAGKLPYVTTMATFLTTRALEMVKVDVAYNHFPVRIAGTHGGLSAGHLGPTHHALEDLAIVRSLPGFTVVVPADAEQTEAAVRETAGAPGPVYLRLGRGATASLRSVVPDPPPFRVGTAQLLVAGDDALLVACGPHPVLAAVKASAQLERWGVRAGVLNLHTLRPFDADGLVEAAARVAAVVTVEEHWRTGGLGGAVAETLAERAPVRVARIGMPDAFAGEAGPQEHLLGRYGIDEGAVVTKVLELIGVVEEPHRNR
jgi:transketolase